MSPDGWRHRFIGSDGGPDPSGNRNHAPSPRAETSHLASPRGGGAPLHQHDLLEDLRPPGMPVRSALPDDMRQPAGAISTYIRAPQQPLRMHPPPFAPQTFSAESAACAKRAAQRSLHRSQLLL